MRQSSDLRGRALLLVQDQPGAPLALGLAANAGANGDSEPLCADRTASRRRRIFQMSALSTVDGTCLAYHGCNG